MKRITTILSALFAAAVLAAAPGRSPQKAYIDKYAPLAVSEMYRSGVPASITLAQGLLESRYGQSELATKGNNHFGIKCHNWKGRKMYKDDDRRNECFRVYKSPDESFRDHSDFLRYRDRYKFLFDLDPTDYKGWAHGLRKAGYATDPAYPKKLINLIEEYDLDEYDKKPSSWARKNMKHKREDGDSVDAAVAAGPPAAADKPVKAVKKLSRKELREARRAERARKKAEKEAAGGSHVQSAELPESPNELEQAKPVDNSQRETLHLSFSRQVYSMNGVPFVRASSGETYGSIAASNNLFLRELLKFNDLDGERPLEPGTVVYLQAKKNKAAAGLDKHIVEGDGETLRDISQRYAVKLDRLCKMNGMDANKELIDGEVIILRK